MQDFKLRIMIPASGWITEVIIRAKNQYDARMIAEGQYGPGCVVGYL